MALYGSLATIEAQLANPSRFTASYAYLRNVFDPASAEHARLLALPVGESQRIELAGGAFAIEQVYTTKTPEAARYESHRTYIDLQAILAGEEFMDVADIAQLTLTEDCWEEKDVAFYASISTGSRWRVGSGQVAVFFPVDGHRPSMSVDGPAIVRKSVVKVPVAAA